MQEPTANHDMSAGPGRDANSSRSMVRINRSWLRMLAFLAVLAASSLLVQSAVQTVVAQERIVAKGILTEVTKDTATIDHKGYIITWATKVFDMHDKRISIADLKLHDLVRFEYVYTGKGPVIQSITVVGE